MHMYRHESEQIASWPMLPVSTRVSLDSDFHCDRACLVLCDSPIRIQYSSSPASLACGWSRKQTESTWTSRSTTQVKIYLRQSHALESIPMQRPIGSSWTPPEDHLHLRLRILIQAHGQRTVCMERDHSPILRATGARSETARTLMGHTRLHRLYRKHRRSATGNL